MPFVENDQEFNAKHEPSGARLKVAENLWSYGDGALVSDGFNQSRFAEPPESEEKSLSLRVQYAKAKLTLIAETFKQLKSRALGGEHLNPVKWDPAFGPKPALCEDDVSGLIALRDLHAKVAKALEKLEREYSDVPAVAARREAERRAEELREQREAEERAQRDKIRAITI